MRFSNKLNIHVHKTKINTDKKRRVFWNVAEHEINEARQ